jgi:hypothetical protein
VANLVEHTTIRFQKTTVMIVCLVDCMKDIVHIVPTDKQAMINSSITSENNTVQKTLQYLVLMNAHLSKVSEMGFHCIINIRLMNTKIHTI